MHGGCQCVLTVIDNADLLNFWDESWKLLLDLSKTIVEFTVRARLLAHSHIVPHYRLHSMS